MVFAQLQRVYSQQLYSDGQKSSRFARCETLSHLSLMAEAFPSVLVRARVCAASTVTVDILLIELLDQKLTKGVAYKSAPGPSPGDSSKSRDQRFHLSYLENGQPVNPSTRSRTYSGKNKLECFHLGNGNWSAETSSLHTICDYSIHIINLKITYPIQGGTWALQV
jgi:hypothetical protein